MKEKERSCLTISRNIHQETQLSAFRKHIPQKKEVLMWKYQWHGNMIFSHGSSNQKGVLVAFRYGLEYKMLSPEVVDDEGRFITLHKEIQGSQ